MATLPRLSTVTLLFAVATGNDGERYPNALCKQTGLPSGTVVPALSRMTDRDGWMTRTLVPSTTGRPRHLHTLTSSGWDEVARLLAMIAPKVKALSAFNEVPPSDGGKANTSTLWILAAGAVSGETYGYSEAMRPLTHQAAYVELHRLASDGWLDTGAEYFTITSKGRAAASHLYAEWMPLVTAVRRLLPD